MDDSGQVDKRKIEFLENFYELLSKEIIIAYRGTFEKSVLSVLIDNLESSLENNSILRRKFFKMFLEFAQNIAIYSAEQIQTSDSEQSGAGLLIIWQHNDNYMITTGNLVETKMMDYIYEKVTYINSLEREALRNYKREQYKLVESGERSNLGLLQIALISGNEVVVNSKPVDDLHSFITISAEVPNEQ
jgi:hypothetical protein